MFLVSSCVEKHVLPLAATFQKAFEPAVFRLHTLGNVSQTVNGDQAQV